MKYLFVFLVVCLTSSVIGQNRYHISETDEPEGSEGVVLISTNKTVTGVVYDEHENGKLSYERNYKDGLQDGLSRWWYKNGQLYIEANYKDGKEVPIVRRWYLNGQMHFEFEYNYKDGKQDGFSRSWHENGQLSYEEIYKEGQLISKKCWDENGNEEECPGRYHVDETNYIDYPEILLLKSTNKPVTGGVYDVHENGKLSYEENYKEGQLISKECWDEEGNEITCP